METTQQRWSLKVRRERDVAEQALSLFLHGRISHCSRALLLSPPSVLYVPSLSLPSADVILFLPTSCFLFSRSSPLSLPATFLSVDQFLFLSLSH